MNEEKEKEEEEIKGDPSQFMLFILNFFRSNGWVVILCIVALLACAYTIYTVSDYQEKINTYWVNEFKTKNCVCGIRVYPYNQSPILPLVNIELPVKE